MVTASKVNIYDLINFNEYKDIFHLTGKNKHIVEVWNRQGDIDIILKVANANNIYELHQYLVDFLDKKESDCLLSDDKLSCQLTNLVEAISYSMIYYTKNSDQNIFNTVDFLLKRYTELYRQIYDIIMRFILRYKDVFSRYEHFDIENTSIDETVTIIRQLFTSSLFDPKYFGDRIGLGLINRMVSRLFDISGSKKAKYNVSYRQPQPFTNNIIRSGSIKDYLLNNFVYTEIKKFASNNKNVDIFINDTVLTYLVIPYINTRTEYFVTYNVAKQYIGSVYNIIFSNKHLRYIVDNLGSINIPYIELVDAQQYLRENTAYIDLASKVIYINTTDKGKHKFGVRLLSRLTPNIKNIIIEYSYDVATLKIILLFLSLIYLYLKDDKTLVYHLLQYFENFE